MPSRSPRWLWAGRVAFALILATLVAYLAAVGLDRADKLASGIGAILALLALGAPYLLPPPQAGGAVMADPDCVKKTGNATAIGGGQANTGLQTGRAGRSVRVTGSGDANADGRGSVANSGIQQDRGRQE